MLKDETQAQRRKKCWACARNQHKKCDLHMNDGAVDAEEFIAVSCDCVCEGKIGTEYDSLIDMVMSYKRMVDFSEQKARTQSILAARSAATADEALELIRSFLGRAYDDEGNLLQDRKGRSFEQALGVMTSGLEQIAREQDAVFSQLMNGDDYSNINGLIKQLFEDHRTPEQKRRDEEMRKPFWERTWNDGSDDAGLQAALQDTDVPDSELSVPIATPDPARGKQSEVEARVERGVFFNGMVKTGQPLNIPLAESDDDWADEGGNPNREDEGWPYDG